MAEASTNSGPGPIIATASPATAAEAAVAAREALAMGASRVEVRLDLLASEEERLKSVELASEHPLLVSGERSATPRDEWRHFERAAELGAWVDIPFQGAQAELLKRIAPSRLMLSWHEKPGEKADALTILREMRRTPAAAYKVVSRAEEIGGNLRARELLAAESSRGDVIAFAAGEAGLPSRVLSLAWGSLATYASAPGCAPAGEGQPSLELLMSCALLEISRETPLIVLLGWPLLFSRTPSFFNKWLREGKRQERYIPVPLKDLAGFGRLAELVNVAGAAVTIPHKEAALETAALVSRLAGAAGAANTLLKRGDAWMAANTDVFGVRSAVRGWTAPHPRVLILGAGGAAAAAAVALRSRGAVALCARDHSKAARLASRTGCAALPWNERATAGWDLLVNATPAGGDGEECPMPEGTLSGTAVLDMVVPESGATPLVKRARAQGLQVFQGEAMLRAQAKLQFKLFTGRRPPSELE